MLLKKIIFSTISVCSLTTYLKWKFLANVLARILFSGAEKNSAGQIFVKELLLQNTFRWLFPKVPKCNLELLLKLIYIIQILFSVYKSNH